MAKKMLFEDEARRTIKKGVDKLADAVRVTMGPKGRNVVISKEFGPPTIINDGVTIAKEIDLEDPFENLGAQLVKEVASKASDVAGDGTTTATVLGQAIYSEGLRNVTAGVNPMALKRGIEKATEALVESLSDAKKIKSKEEIAQVASISANNDSEIGGLIADAMQAVGKDGVITVEEAQGVKTTVSTTDGMEFEQGYISPYFVNRPNMTTELDNPLILLHEKRISSLKSIMPLLELSVQNGNRPIVVIAEDVDGDALTGLLINKAKEVVKSVAIKSPGFGDRSRPLLQDLAVLTNGKLISPELGNNLESLQLADLGSARKVIVSRDSTTIVDGGGSKVDIDNRISQIKKQIEEASSGYDKEKLQERLAKLTGGVAVLNVGAATQVEMKEKKARIDDALHATRAAVEEGILPGGGVALVRASKVLDGIEGTEDELVGVDIVRRAISAPLKQIAVNAGIDGEVALENVLRAEGDIGLNAATGKYEDLVKAGVIDPAKVTRSALQNAASVSALMLTTECLVVEEKKESEALPGVNSNPFPG